MQTRHATHPTRRTRRKTQGRTELPEQLRPLPKALPRNRRVWLQLVVGVSLSLAGLISVSVLIDHCAQDSRFCNTPKPSVSAAIDPVTADPEPMLAVEATPAPSPRAVMAHAFAPLPLSFDGETTRSFVLPPGQSMLDMATELGRIAVDEVSLIAVVRQNGVRHALVRLPDGRILRLQQGDRLEGGTVAAISAEAIYLIGPDMAPRALILGG